MEAPSTSVGLRFSVIIPARNDAGVIEETVASAQALPGVQVLVVDAGSSDGTTVVARLAGAKVLRRPGERGRQLQAGVAAASGDVLIFVSPGTRLPADALEAVRIALADTKVLGGVFACSFAGGRGLVARVAHGVLGLLGLTPFGAPWFVWRTAAEGEGTIKRYRVFEDRDLLRRLRRNGTVTRLSSVAILDSRHGLHRFFWTLLQLPYDMGFSPRILGKLYHKPRSSASQRAIPAIEAIEERELIRAEPAPT